MTQLVAAWNATSVVLASDSMVQRPDGTTYSDCKMSILNGRFAVMSSGHGPANTRDVVQQTLVADCTRVGEVGLRLITAFNWVAPPMDFDLVIAGIEGGVPAVYIAKIPAALLGDASAQHKLQWCPTGHDLSNEPSWLSIENANALSVEQLTARCVAHVCTAIRLVPTHVGPPITAAIVDGTGARLIS